MKLIVGLGNPGTKYAGTRHNIGFDTVTALSDLHGIALDRKECKAVCGRGFIGGEKVILAQPQTFMNNSGESVRAFMDFYKLSPEDVLIIYDDIDLEPGHIRIRKKGSAGGHNGMKSIISHMGTDTFSRIRLGVGKKPEGWDLADWVLARFPKELEPEIRETLKTACEAVGVVLSEGMDSAMNRFSH